MDSLALILILIPIALLSLLAYRQGRKMDILISELDLARRSPMRDRRAEPRNTLDSFLLTQRHWSAKTFGLGAGRWRGIVAHVEKELREIERDPLDLEEWIDVIILGFDGAWRTGASNHAIIAALFAKQAKNRQREWVVSEDESVPAEHVRPKLSDVLMPGLDPAKGKDRTSTMMVERVAHPASLTSIDISVYTHKVTGKWVVQVGDDTSHLAQFESEEAARQYARQTGDALRMQMKHLEEKLSPLFIVEPVEPVEAADPPVYAVDAPGGQPKKTNLRRLSAEEQQRILSDPEAYTEWRGPCGLEPDEPKEDRPGRVT